jgi:hypothetical protein
MCKECPHPCKEVWNDIPGYENKYQISNKGYVRNSTQFMIPWIKRERLAVTLRKPGDKKHHYIHRLVATMYVPNDKPEIKKEVNHKKCKPWDNRHCQLEWIESTENKKHYHRHIKESIK